MRLFLVFPILFMTFFANIGLSCTTVFWNNNGIANVVARSTDLFISDSPKLVIKPRGMTNVGEAGDNSLKWTSKYGSVVVTAFDTYAVSDGMNEHGFAVHLLYLSKTEYPKRDVKIPGLSNLLWSQYFLDNFKTVKEALAAEKKFQLVAAEVHGQTWPIHLAMEDPSGDSAVIEYIEGKVKIYHGPQYQVMTNEPAYNIQLANLKNYLPFGGKLSLPGDSDPLSRFVRVATYLKTLPKPASTLDALAGVLSVIRTAAVPFGAVDHSGNKVEDAWPTRWISLADLNNKIYYFNSTTTPNIIWLDFNNLNFSQGEPVLVLDPNALTLVGEVSKMTKSMK